MADNKPVHAVRIPTIPTEKVLYEMQKAIRESEGMAPLNVLRNVYTAVVTHGQEKRG